MKSQRLFVIDLHDLIPFQTIYTYIENHQRYNTNILIANLLGNIVLFIPIGIFIPLLNKKYMKTTSFLLLTFLILISVELIQMISKYGSLDVDDIILNSLGAIIGFYITKSFIIMIKRFFSLSLEDEDDAISTS